MNLFRPRSSIRLAAGSLVLALVALGGCAESSLDLPTSGDLDLVLTVSPKTISSGGEVVISTSAIGTSLLGTVIEYGEGSVDSIQAAGAQTQTATRSWTYPNPGVFVIRATVDDSFQGRLTREDTVTVN